MVIQEYLREVKLGQTAIHKNRHENGRTKPIHQHISIMFESVQRKQTKKNFKKNHVKHDNRVYLSITLKKYTIFLVL